MEKLDSFLNIKYFTVSVSRVESSTIEIAVEAKDEIEAHEKALEAAYNMAFPRSSYANYHIDRVQKIKLWEK